MCKPNRGRCGIYIENFLRVCVYLDPITPRKESLTFVHRLFAARITHSPSLAQPSRVSVSTRQIPLRVSCYFLAFLLSKGARARSVSCAQARASGQDVGGASLARQVLLAGWHVAHGGALMALRALAEAECAWLARHTDLGALSRQSCRSTLAVLLAKPRSSTERASRPSLTAGLTRSPCSRRWAAAAAMGAASRSPRC